MKKREEIEFYRSDSLLIDDAIDRIVVEIHQRKKLFDKNTVLFTGCSAGSGTTATVINLAIALAQAGWKTLLIDCDLRKKSEYKRLNQDDEIGLSDYLSGVAKKEEVIYDSNYENMRYIPGGKSAGRAIRLLCTQEMENLLKEVKNEYDYVILDLPSINIVSDADILAPFVDGIVLMAALNQTTKPQLANAKRKMLKYGDKFYGIIVNKVELSQYKKVIKDYDYFRTKNLSKKYEKNLEKKRKQNKSWNGDEFENEDVRKENKNEK